MGNDSRLAAAWTAVVDADAVAAAVALAERTEDTAVVVVADFAAADKK